MNDSLRKYIVFIALLSLGSWGCRIPTKSSHEATSHEATSHEATSHEATSHEATGKAVRNEGWGGWQLSDKLATSVRKSIVSEDKKRNLKSLEGRRTAFSRQYSDLSDR
jgi:hypothetical protein